MQKAWIATYGELTGKLLKMWWSGNYPENGHVEGHDIGKRAANESKRLEDSVDRESWRSVIEAIKVPQS